ncbi:M23 family metallopeptidase [Beijerinckia indica]|uniref:Peptidase M23 n=1 Tax=Beijerinckia indica subsp. indica (strain ATCC 9039 / DSM 1715 / NCIMB 8712) TaxID=395963 RepID=B2IE48_BEII9|nr:M23 family metallopeptidase [Beijerinckia indica]ACB94072.1 Peptidase M23 [Beijerinckia indica subsp. indica ATCC 9039]
MHFYGGVMRMRSLAAYRSTDRRGGAVELGNEPAIDTDGEQHDIFDRRQVSLRWLAGTILTGLSGAGLIGAAIYAAFDHQSHFAEAPMLAAPPHRETAQESGINGRKGDRLVKSVDIVAAKQSFRAPMTLKIGEKEVVKTHSFTRVETTLLQASAGYGDDIPPFNPLKLLADARNPVDVPQEPVQDDAEVSWALRDLVGQPVSTQAVLSGDEVQAQLAEQIKNPMNAGTKLLTLPPQMLLMKTSRANPLGNGIGHNFGRSGAAAVLAYANPEDTGLNAPFSSIDVRMVPENVTVVARSSASPQSTQSGEKLVVLRHGEAVEDILRNAGLSKDRIAAIIQAFGARRGEAAVAEGRKLKLQFADFDGSGGEAILARLSVYADETLETTIAMTDQGRYMRVISRNEEPVARRRSEDTDDDDAGGMRLYESLYETALKQDIPRRIVDELVRIFANDVDFQRTVAAGDSFSAFYDEAEEGDHLPELLYATVTTRNETFRYYRFQTPDDNGVDFYDPNGRSTRKFLVRVPLAAEKMTSGFGTRFHPILGYSRPHTGVDWAAPIGTPIFAAGNGTVLKAGWDSGYGRRVEIQHANGYITTYNHMSGFAKGMSEGMRVRQGQVIGYLGQTGLATGPHLHYEVIVNGHFVDPLRVKLAQTREFDGPMLATFKRERERIDGLLALAPNATSSIVADRRGNRNRAIP